MVEGNGLLSRSHELQYFKRRFNHLTVATMDMPANLSPCWLGAPLWETCFWIKFPGGRRYLAEILERRVPPELPGVILRVRPENHASLVRETAPAGEPLYTNCEHPEYCAYDDFGGLFPNAIPLEGATGAFYDRAFLVLAGVDDSWMAPELATLDADELLAQELARVVDRLTPDQPTGGRNVCNECWNDQQYSCCFCRREMCYHRQAETHEIIFLCRACHLALWLRGYSGTGVRVGHASANPERFVCTAAKPWTPKQAFIHATSHPDARNVWREHPFEDLWFDYVSCPHCSIEFFDFVSK